MFFDHTDLRIGASRAKFDAESDFDVRFAVAPPKPSKKYENLNFRAKKSLTKFFWRQKMKCRESSETRFGKFSRRSEPCLKGKRPFEVRE